jgi:hypothetical protein
MIMLRNATIEKGTIGVYPDNPHYFIYKGKPVILITSAEHYGSLINLGFEYAGYFDTLEKYGLNYTRIYPGAYIEIEGMFIEGNTLAPDQDHLVLPWARSSEPGYPGGGNKFDLGRWDERYFARYKDYLEQARKRDIIVEVCFFNCQYPESYMYCPMNEQSNVQRIGTCSCQDFQTLKDAPLVEAQKRYVEKLVLEANEFDNVIFEFIDEPTLYRTSSQEATAWISSLIDVAVKTEELLPRKHILAQQLEIGIDFAGDDRVPLIVSQYITGMSRQIGGIPALNTQYDLGKPIELNETAFLPVWYLTDEVASSRIEAWEFMVGGGAGFNQLNGYYTASDPTGGTPKNIRILENLKNLKAFIHGFEFFKMKRFNSFDSSDRQAVLNGMSEKGRQYAFYMHHSAPNRGDFANSYYTVNEGDFTTDISFELPAGKYKVEWTEPESLKIVRSDILVHDGGVRELHGPSYKIDLALAIAAAK